MIRYLETVFEPEEYVGIVVDAFRPEGRDCYVPKKGVFGRSRQEIVEALKASGGDYRPVLGDTIPEVGAWVRINPLDGKGVADANVTAFRHSLIEADSQDLGKQLALIREMKLPCSAIVHSGGKSIHAIVRVDADSYEEYRKRVNRLYAICEASGLKVDPACRNPSRLSRLPGVARGSRPQYMIAGPSGCESWEKWLEHVEEEQDNLPDPEPIPGSRLDLPPLAPELIAGILRVGHKLRLTGPSKGGKSFGLMELAVCVANGLPWWGFDVRQGRVLYLNLELARESGFHRFHDVADELCLGLGALEGVTMWNLRGFATPISKLAPKLIRFAAGKGFSLVIIDPIYKVQDGDESDPQDVARFCAVIDHISVQLGAAVVDCHHHSKGSQGQKRSIDRGSGSGVFGRDPDAILDMVELIIDKDRRAQVVNSYVMGRVAEYLAACGQSIDDVPDDRRVWDKVVLEVERQWPKLAEGLRADMPGWGEAAEGMTGWRVESSLREFKAAKPARIWFRAPVHEPDKWGLLLDAKAEGEEPPWVAKRKATAEAKDSEWGSKMKALEKGIEAAGGAGQATVSRVAELLGKDADTVRSWVGKSKGWKKGKKGVILERESVEDGLKDE